MRIIAGKLKGRKIPVPEIEALRPTPDRVRETLFNWLQQDIVNANCLDLFAGSGALSFEAISRGAKRVYCFDSHPTVVQHLNATAKSFQLQQLKIQKARFPEAFAQLQLPDESIDIVFLDPPFQKNYPQQCLQYLHSANFLKANSLIYLETEKNFDLPNDDNRWQILKEKFAGQVAFRLLVPIAHQA